MVASLFFTYQLFPQNFTLSDLRELYCRLECYSSAERAQDCLAAGSCCSAPERCSERAQRWSHRLAADRNPRRTARNRRQPMDRSRDTSRDRHSSLPEANTDPTRNTRTDSHMDNPTSCCPNKGIRNRSPSHPSRIHNSNSLRPNPSHYYPIRRRSRRPDPICRDYRIVR